MPLPAYAELFYGLNLVEVIPVKKVIEVTEWEAI